MLLFSSKELKSYLNFHAQWDGGFEFSNSRLGEKPGSIIAGSYSIIVNLGVEGFKKTIKSIVESV